MDIAELGLKVDSGGVVSADKALDDFAKAASNAEKATDKFNSEAQKGSGVVKKFGDQVDASGKSMTFIKGAIMGAVGAITAFVGAAVSIKAFVDSTAEAEKVQAQLAAALASTHGASGQTIDSLNEMATSLMGVSTFGDEAIGTAQSLLLTFTRIGGDVFPRATQAVLDLATRMGGDLNGAAMKLGKALNDPILGLTMLSRSGIQFTEAQQAMITKLSESGRLIEAQTIILDEFEKKLGGSALAARETLGGAITALNEAFGNLFELSGPASDQLRMAIEGLIVAISDPAFMGFIQMIGVAFFTAMRGAVEMVNILAGSLPALGSALATIAPAMLVAFGPSVLAGIQALGATIMGTVVRSVLALNAAILANPMVAFVAVIATVIAYMVDWEQVIQTLIQAWALFTYEWHTFWGNEAGAKRSIEIGINASGAVAELKKTAVEMSSTLTNGFSVGGSDAGQKVHNAMVTGGGNAAAQISQAMKMTGEKAQAIYDDLNGKVIEPLGNVLVEGGKFIHNQVTGAIEKVAKVGGDKLGEGVKEGGKEAGGMIRNQMVAAGNQVGASLFQQLAALGDKWSNALQTTLGDLIGKMINAQIGLLNAQSLQARAQAELYAQQAAQLLEAPGRSGRGGGGSSSGSSSGSRRGGWGEATVGQALEPQKTTADAFVGPAGKFITQGITDGSELLPGYKDMPSYPKQVTSGGLAEGGSFTVPGSGGTDTRTVSFRASPGERVTVETPSQQQSGKEGGGLVIQNFFDPKDMLNALQTSEGRDVLTNYITANRDELQTLLGVN